MDISGSSSPSSCVNTPSLNKSLAKAPNLLISGSPSSSVEAAWGFAICFSSVSSSSSSSSLASRKSEILELASFLGSSPPSVLAIVSPTVFLGFSGAASSTCLTIS